jgi:hypothetical protein
MTNKPSNYVEQKLTAGRGEMDNCPIMAGATSQSWVNGQTRNNK